MSHSFVLVSSHAEPLRAALERHGSVVVVRETASAIDTDADAIVLGPGIDDATLERWCRTIRAQGCDAVLIALSDHVAIALESGADSCLPPTADATVIVAQMAAIERRRAAVARHAATARAAEQTAAESDARFQFLVDALPHIVWTAGPDGSQTFANRRWSEFTGAPSGPTDPDGWRAIVHPDDEAETDRAWAEAVRTGEPYACLHRIRRRDGEWRSVLSRAVPQTDADGRVIRWFGTGTDVTDLRRAEEALREADRRKDRFLATLAHELRNPLAPIRFALEILRRDPGGAGRDRATGVIGRQVTQLVRLIDDLLDVSRITQNKIRLRTEPLDIATSMREVAETIAPGIEAAGHTLAIELPAVPVVIDADPARIVQIFSNLLSNAIKFTPPGGRITFSARFDGEFVRLAVADSGIGMEPEAIERIFEPFHQENVSIERAAGGLGIGLTLTRALVEMHHGTISARSEGPGLGSVFEVSLRGRPAPARLAQDRLRPAARVADQTLRVLVVDDDADAAEMLAAFVSNLGHTTALASDGRSALAAAREFCPEVVLLDIGLPLKNGYEVAEELRRSDEVPVLVAVTGWGQENDRRDAVAAGFDHHITKPADPNAIARVLSEALRKRTAGDSVDG